MIDAFLVRGHTIGLEHPLFLIAGPCVIESESMAMATAENLREIGERLGLLIVYKSSFDKANRSAGSSFRGPGLKDGLRILAKIREQLDMPVLTDVHELQQVADVAAVVDMLQTPAFLARQTDLIEAVATCGRPVNIKKGQFMAPGDMVNVVAKGREAARAAGMPSPPLMVCDRGASFGYHNLVSDMRGLVIMRETLCPVLFDATHSVQLPGAQGSSSGGQREFVPVLARAAVAVGVAGVFMETHPDPGKALSDGANAVPLDRFEELSRELRDLDSFTKQQARVSL